MEKEKIKNNDSNILVFVNGIPIIESISNEEKIMLASKYERVIFELFEEDNRTKNCRKNDT